MKFNYIKNTARTFGMLLLMAAPMSFTACSSSDEAFFTADENDSPRILNTDIPEWVNGEPAVLKTITRTDNFNFKVIATPIHYTTVDWYLDGEKVFEGTTINQPVEAGTYILKIVATTTKGLSTSRTTKLVVNPAEGDPVLNESITERFVAAGKTATIHGQNLDKVSGIVIGGKEAQNVKVDGDAISFTVPSDLKDSTYRASLVGADGFKYGVGKFNVTSSVLVANGDLRTDNGVVTLKGLNLDKLTSVKVGDTQANITEQTATSITLNLGNLAAGEYDVTATTKDGRAASFYVDNKMVTKGRLTVLSEKIIWENADGFGVNWNVFDQVNGQITAAAKVGMKIKVGYVLNDPNGENYHQIRFMGDWDFVFPEYANDYKLNGAVGEKGIAEITLSDKDVDIIKNHGFRMSGYGYAITMISYK